MVPLFLEPTDLDDATRPRVASSLRVILPELQKKATTQRCRLEFVS